MSFTSSIRAGGAFLEISLKDNLAGGLNRAGRRLKAFGVGVRNVGAGMLAVGAAAATPFIASVRIFADFADKMSEVRAVTGATEADFQRLQEEAKRLGAATSFSAREVAEGMKFLGQAGFTTEQILAGIPAVLNLARAGALDLGVASDIASDVGSAFGLSANEIARVADVMAVTASSANTNIEMMGQSLKFAAPLAKAAGQSLEDTSAAIGVLGNSGIKATTAGTDLALIMKKLADNGTQESLAEVGVSAVDASGKMRSLGDVMRDLGEATRGMTDQQRLSFFADNFDRAAKSAIILSDAGDSFSDLRGKIGDSEGAAEEMAKTMDDNIGGSFRSLKSSVEGVAIAIGEAIAEPVAEFADSAKRTAQWVGLVIKNNKGLIRTVVGVIAVVAAVGAGLVVLGTIIGAISFAFTGLAAAASAAGTAVGILTTIIGALFTPIGLIVVSVVGLIALLLYLTGAAQIAFNYLKEAFGSLKDTAMKAFGGIKDAMAVGDLELAAKILWLGLKLEFQKGVHFLTEIWVGFKEMFISIFNQAVAAVQKTWNRALGLIAKGAAKMGDLLNSDTLRGASASVEGSIESDEAIDRRSRQAADARTEAFAQQLQESEASIKAARKEFEEAIGQAAKARAALDAEDEKTDDQEKLPELPDLSGVGQQIKQAAETRGTFSAAAASRLGQAGGPAQRTAKAAEEIAGNTKKLLDEARHGGLEFA